MPIIVLMPPVFEKYKAELFSVVDKANTYGISFFVDLQNNGEKERVEVFEAGGNLLSFQVFDQNNGLYNQYNYSHFFNSHLNQLFFFDVDKDFLKEVYGFSVLNDSIFINYVEPFDPNHKFHSYFVATIDTERRKQLDVSVGEMVLFDLDNDSDEELVFSFSVGYNWFPRKIFVFHPQTGKIESSEEFGVHFSSLAPFDYNSDGKKELLCISSSAHNIDPGTDVKYYDDRPRIFVFNENLKESIPPVEFSQGIGSRLQYKIVDYESKELMIFVHNFTSGNEITYLTKIYADGTPAIADTIFLNKSESKKVQLFRTGENRFFTCSSRGEILWFNTDLEILESIDLKYKTDYVVRGMIDIVDNGIPEFCTISDNQILHIYFENFKHELQIEYENGDYSGTVLKSPHKNEIIIDARGRLTVYKVGLNPLYYLKFPVYVLIYFITIGFIYLIQLARLTQLKEKLELQHRVKELQFISLKNQLDPHFIFNTFNTIASTIKQGKNDEAYDLMIRFSKLVRINMEDSEGIYTSIKKELKFVEDYLAIQKIRFKDLFEYEIKIDKSLKTEISIPKLLVQIHVENALKHGIRPLVKDGLLSVIVSKELSGLEIEIVDNGIGRKESKQNYSESNGVGLKAIKQIIELNNQNSKHKISQQIVDLENIDGSSAGTKVILRIMA